MPDVGSREWNRLMEASIGRGWDEMQVAEALELLYQAAKGNTNIDDFGPLVEAYRIVKQAIGGGE